MVRILWVCAVLALASVGFAGSGPREFNAPRLATPAVIDGTINEAEWAGAATGEGSTDLLAKTPAEEATQFWLAFDEKYVYFAARMTDSHPESIIAQETRKNVALDGNDSITLVLDVLGNLTDFNIFSMNPAGANSIQIAGGRAAKAEWLGEIATSGSVTSTGWEAEARIPWKLMRLPNAGERTIRFNVRRYIPRLQRDFGWVVTDGDGIANLGRVNGVNIPKGDDQGLIKLLPYTYVGQTEDQFIFNSGLDFRTNLMNRLELVGSINPDFRNIENQILSLDFSYFERLAGESRPFFAEGKSYFNTGYDSRLFASQRVDSFDAGVKVFGKLNDKSKFGIMDLHTFGKENAFVGSFNYKASSRTSLDLSVTSLRRDGVSNDGFFANYSAGIGPNLYYLNMMTTADRALGTGSRFTGGFFSEIPGKNFYLDFSNVDENFRPRLGFNSEVDLRGASAGGGITQTIQTGPLMETEWSLDGGAYWRQDGDPYRRSLSASLSLTWRNGIDLDLFAKNQRFEENNDEYYSMSIEWPRRDRYRRYEYGYAFGHLEGKAYSSHSVTAAITPHRDLQIAGSAQFVKHFEEATQMIVSANWDLHNNRSVSGRLVRRDNDWNGYVSFRQSGGLGTEYFLILGDPNSRSFRSSVILKVTTPFDLRI